MNRGLLSILLLVVSNSFMTIAWYGHLKFNIANKWGKWGIFAVIVISWSIALFEYIFQVPANRIGFKDFGGPFSLVQLKVIQETFRMNHFIAFLFLVLAVFFIFKD